VAVVIHLRGGFTDRRRYYCHIHFEEEETAKEKQEQQQ